MTAPHLRKIRSFVKRPGRITRAQQRALDTLLPRHGLPRDAGRLDLAAVFGREAPRVLEIGFGDGQALLTAAANNPHVDYLGVEVHEPGIGHLLLTLEQARLSNVRVLHGDAVELLDRVLPDACCRAVNLFFPDPWPKKRHHKRRIVQTGFVNEVARVLEDGGLLHVASDWGDYADHARAVLDRCPLFAPEREENLCENPLAFRPPTKFEQRGRRLGHDIVDLYYRRTPREPDGQA